MDCSGNITTKKVTMENSIYLALSKQMVLRTNMDVVSNNIANMNTSGFRGQNPVFEEFLSDPRGSDDALSFVYDYGQYQMTDPGSFEQTGNPLHVALNGDGYMSVEMPGGQVGYTRDGNFQKRSDGTLVTSAGYAVIGQGGPITIPNDATEIRIDQKGIISDQNGPVGQLGIVEFENVQDLEAVGNNLYTTQGATRPSENTTVEQGFIEGSNVKPVVEMTNMIKILREFQSTQNVLKTEHERLRSAIQKLTQA